MSATDIQADINQVKGNLRPQDGIKEIKFCQAYGQVVIMYANKKREALSPKNFRLRFVNSLW